MEYCDTCGGVPKFGPACIHLSPVEVARRSAIACLVYANGGEFRVGGKHADLAKCADLYLEEFWDADTDEYVMRLTKRKGAETK